MAHTFSCRKNFFKAVKKKSVYNKKIPSIVSEKSEILQVDLWTNTNKRKWKESADGEVGEFGGRRERPQQARPGGVRPSREGEGEEGRCRCRAHRRPGPLPAQRGAGAGSEASEAVRRGKAPAQHENLQTVALRRTLSLKVFLRSACEASPWSGGGRTRITWRVPLGPNTRAEADAGYTSPA